MNCEICGSTMGEQAAVCTPCTGTLKAALTEIVGDEHLHGLDADLDIAIAKQSVFPREGAHVRPAEAPLLIDMHASEAAAVLRSTLTTWCRVLLDERDGTPPADTLAALALWLHERTEHIRHAPWGAEAVDEIRAAVHQARRAVDRPAERVYAGPCPSCGQQVYAPTGRDTARCRRDGCEGEVEDPEGRRMTMARQAVAEAPGREVTATEGALAARALGYRISDRWIRKLDELGRLEAVREERPRRYRLGDIIEAAGKGERKAS